MNTIIKFNTSFGTLNMGDLIINRSVNSELNYLLKDNFVIEYPTHTPVTTFYQTDKNNPLMKRCKIAKYKFLCGTNILSKNMFRPWPNWNTNLFNCAPYRGVVLVGCGINRYFKKANIYTRLIYRKVLSKKYIHSVRDERTKIFLEKMGYKAINTGCPTLWSLNSQFCKSIPKNKAKNVIFTLTDYCKDFEHDQRLINILKDKYEKVYFWIQGSGDLDYFYSFDNTDGIELVSPNLEAYEAVLNKGNIDYVGTRLHAGIFAMQHKIRSIILIVDNRARDMKETYNLVAIERNDIDKIRLMIDASFSTDVGIDESRINEWKAQFD